MFNSNKLGALWVKGKEIKGTIDLGVLGDINVLLKKNTNKDARDDDYEYFFMVGEKVVGGVNVKERVEQGETIKYMSGTLKVGMMSIAIVVFKNNFKQKSNQPDYNIFCL